MNVIYSFLLVCLFFAFLLSARVNPFTVKSELARLESGKSVRLNPRTGEASQAQIHWDLIKNELVTEGRAGHALQFHVVEGVLTYSDSGDYASGLKVSFLSMNPAEKIMSPVASSVTDDLGRFFLRHEAPAGKYLLSVSGPKAK